MCHRQAMQRTKRPALRLMAVGGSGLGQGTFGVDGDQGIEHGVAPFDLRQARLGQLPRRQVSRANFGGQLPGGPCGQVA
ncbi:hypothetical protein D3C76_850380 [compost metagenome]